MPNHHTYRFDRDMKHDHGHRPGHGHHGHGRAPHHHRPGLFPIFPPFPGAPWWIWPSLTNNGKR